MKAVLFRNALIAALVLATVVVATGIIAIGQPMAEHAATPQRTHTFVPF